MEYRWSSTAIKQLNKLVQFDRRRIVIKLDEWFGQPDPLDFAKRLSGYKVATFRFRIGSYRIIAERDSNVLTIVRVADRKDAYR